MSSELLKQTISFQLNQISGIPAYLQIVQQVEQALRIGSLRPGDKLPTVREVVAEVTINPNTVKRAYRELEYAGLVEGRQGVGTFVLRRPQGPPPEEQIRLAHGLERWIEKARAAGLESQAMEAIASLAPAKRVASRRRMNDNPLAVETLGLSKRYGSTWGLQDCSIEVPEGRISALVGPNGAGKTTLLRLLIGLRRPTSGEARVLGRLPTQDEKYLASIGFLAQETPLYRQFSASEHLRIGAHLNRRWDASTAEQRLTALRIPLDRPVHSLSGGQRAQVALSLALAKHPRVLLLDEPLAALDPLARREFLTSLAEVTVDGDVTVVLSSHLVHDLERVCSHLILLAASRVRLCADIDEVLSAHRVLVGPRRSTAELERLLTVVRVTQTERQSRVLAKLDGPVLDLAWEVSEVGLEDIILAYMAQDEALAAGPLSAAGGVA